jgi:hypothetical protein
MTSYDDWKTTDPADRDPYRDTDCRYCGAAEGYRCAPECDCPDCDNYDGPDDAEAWAGGFAENH